MPSTVASQLSNAANKDWTLRMSSLTSIVTEIRSNEALGNTYALQVSWSVLADDGQVDPRAAHQQTDRSRLHKATSRARDGHRVPPDRLAKYN
jgi:hypothetical protein